MPARIHMHLSVSNLEASRVFYEKFFGLAPVKAREGYLKFLPDFAPVNLALSPRRRGAGGDAPVNHAGVQVDSTQEVLDHLARIQTAGLDVRVEMGTNCCHANQDKFWVKDPDGLEWEVYHLNYDLPDEQPHLATGKRLLPMASGAACCR